MGLPGNFLSRLNKNYRKFMLTQNQEKYLQTIPENKIVKIIPYNPKVLEIVSEIKQKIQDAGINLAVEHMGASALGISGQGDIDLYILCDKKKYDQYLPKLEELFGKRISGISINKWNLEIQEIEVELYITDPTAPDMKEQIEVFQKLKQNPALLTEYETIKSMADGLSFREYMRRKYEFFNDIIKI